MGERDPADVRDVIREERSRGRRPISTEARRRAKRLLVRELLAEEDEATFLESIRALGLQQGSTRWRNARNAWHDAWRGRQQERHGRR